MGFITLYLLALALLASNPEHAGSQWMIRQSLGPEYHWAWREAPVVQLRSIPSMSMAPTILTGDRVLAMRYGRVPQRGDIWVFDHPNSDKVMVNRIVGLGGDTIEMKGGRLHLNGKRVERVFVRSFEYLDEGRYTPATEYGEQLPGESRMHLIHEFSDADGLDETPLFEVPVSHYFMLGDNRDNSEDSRAPSGHRALATGAPEGWPLRPSYLPRDPRDDAIGFVPMENLIARVVTVPISLHECTPAVLSTPSQACLRSNINKRL